MDRKVALQLAKKYGTPLYIFDTDAFRQRAELVKHTFGEKVHCCYSIKANPFLLRDIPECFSNYEVCSPGELTICEKTGVDMKKVIFSGVNKRLSEIARAMDDGVGMFTVESRLHMERIQDCALQRNLVVPVLVRLTSGSQFGMDEAEIIDLINRRKEYPNIRITGLHFFSGTQKKKVAVIEKELRKLDEFAQKILSETGFSIERIEYGTGLNVDYFGENPDASERALLEEAAVSIREMGENYHLTIEMGRFFAAPCGTYITKVEDVKTNKGYHYAICDGGLNQLKYDGQVKGMQTPEIVILNEKAVSEGKERYTLCGSLCTTADVLATIETNQLEVGDLLAFGRTGAYSVMEGMAVFLSREMPAVVLYSKAEGDRLVRDFILTDPLNTPNETERQA